MSPGMRLGAAVLGVTVAAALVVVAAQLLRPPIAADRTSAAPSPTATADPAAGALQWQLPEQEWPALPAADPQSPLYEAQATALDAVEPAALVGCPEPGVVADEAAWRSAVTAQWECLHLAWTPHLVSLGWSTEPPELHFFDGLGTASECGYLEAPAFYCSTGGGSAHFGSRHLRMAGEWDLSINEMVNHEYGHHLQKLAGITDVKMGLKSSDEVERRVELQATCWSGAMTYRNESVGFDAADFASWTARLETMLVDGVHGSRDSLRYWGMRGLYAETMGDCNTWVVAAQAVA
ncbi:neutral zinc metallopeptidase [Tessaracoccus flavus]|uniref:Uncharacterized protein n=1 Tax=Tessaracoccus flavus TaxID=1610493 RepID=A0A1Q2CCX6_9ACTN|nr:neutral zinc metallopeptidase [Tessaracoccus flavus]AQP43947.1 hypothetical protein RPIT_03210 [Tessaracoccus flavus]SDY29610.1 hypothetical protein SAMN05428934_101243 [Tessaracoccus flavus]